MERFDIVIVGGGIVGLATARSLASQGRYRVAVLEAEDDIARHQTGHNSGVIHSGLYYRPGSLKARNCIAGREALYAFCREHGIAHERCGKLVVATEPGELDALDELERRGRANGLTGLRRLRPEEIREVEPHAIGVAGLLVPETGIVDFREVARAFADEIRGAGGAILTGTRVAAVNPDSDRLVVESERSSVSCSHLINCAGLQCDRLARLCGLELDLRIVPFRGDYYEVRPEMHHLVRNLIYPVPDPRFPFLGVHLTRTVDGRLEAGPNAVLALHREGYGRWHFSRRDAFDTLSFGGFWRLAGRQGRLAIGEMVRSLTRRAFVEALKRLVPEIGVGDVAPAGCGIRAQAVSSGGDLVDDFRIFDGQRSTHVINTPSPAATASISIGATIAKRVAESLATG